jgi:hypothetical protein
MQMIPSLMINLSEFSTAMFVVMESSSLALENTRLAFAAGQEEQNM